MMMQKILRWSKKYTVFILSSILFFLMQFCMQVPMGDETVYMNYLRENTLFSQLSYFSQTWSNRLVVDGLAMLILSLPMVIFKLLNSLVFFSTQIGVYRLSGFGLQEENRKFAIAVFMYLIPFSSFLDAGFSVTSIYYLWTTTAGIWAIYISIAEKKHHISYILGPILTLIACNMEQVAILVVAVLGTHVIYCIVNKKRNVLCMLETMISLIDLGYLLLGPGAKYRAILEAGKCFPEFDMLTATQKVDMGLSTTMYHFLFEGDFIWLLLTGCLCVLVYENYESCGYRLLGGIPCFLTIGFYLGQDFETTIPGIGALKHGFEEYGTIYLANFDMRCKWISLFLMGGIIITIYVQFFLLFSFQLEFFLYSLLFSVGLVTRLVMGFSPTIYESGKRTYLLFWMIGLFMVLRLLPKLTEENRKRILQICVIFGIIQTSCFWYSLS